LGTVFNWALLGVLSFQLYMFHGNFPNERKAIKALVYTMYCLDLVQTVSTTYFAWFMLVDGWGNPLVFVQVPWPGVAQSILTGIISAMAQIYYAWRIHILKPGKKPFEALACLIILTALLQCSCGLASGIRLAFAADVSTIATLELTVKIWLGGSFAVDITIALTMIYIFYEARRESVSRRTNVILRRLIFSAIETGSVTAVTAGLDLFLYLKNKENYLHLLPSLLLGKLYSIVVVACLNARLRHKSHLPTTIHTSDFRYGLSNRDSSMMYPPISPMSADETTVISVSTDLKRSGCIESPSETKCSV